MQFSAEKYEKQSSYVIQSTEYNNLLHVHKVRAQSEKLDIILLNKLTHSLITLTCDERAIASN